MNRLQFATILSAFAMLSACASHEDEPFTVDPNEVAEESAAASACATMPAPVHHRVKPQNGASLYTLSASEATNAGTNYGFSDNRGVPFYVSASSTSGLLPVYRLYNASNGDFFWTIDEAERASAKASYGYADQGVNFFASRTTQTCLVPIYRYVSNSLQKHRFAVTQSQRDALASSGWINEGIRFYAAPEASTPPPPPPPPPPGDTKFSFVVIPDTQQEIVYRTELFTNRVSWIVNNKAAEDIRFVMQTGDLMDWDTPDHIHYVRGSEFLRPLNTAGIPYAIAVGNHDTAAVCVGGSACPGNVNANLRNTTTYNTYFPASSFANLRGSFEGKRENAYHTFEAGGLKWMVLNLELWARNNAIDWANGVIAANPTHNVIVITHMHLNGDGSISTSNGGYGNNSPQYVYDNLLKKYANVRMVFSGHVGSHAYRENTGNNGNKIYQFLNCFHDGNTNPTRIVEIDTAANTLATRVYAPYNNTTRADAARTVTNISWVR